MPAQPSKEKHHHETLRFPKNFIWGAATSAHQVEGNNIHSDWWEWEQKFQPPAKRSGIACDHYNRYQEDFDLAQKLSHNAHRLSIEWARIEPEEGLFNLDAIEHYKQVLIGLKNRGLKVMLTLHHFTNPAWITKKGGWENPMAPVWFEKFVQKIVPDLKDYVDFWITINEPMILCGASYIVGVWPPQKQSKFAFITAFNHLAIAHRKAYHVIHAASPASQVGIASNVSSFQAFHNHSLWEELAQWGFDNSYNHLFYFLTDKKTHDFLGLNYYINRYISLNGESTIPSLIDVSVTKKDVSDMGWEIYPEGIFDVLMDFSDYHLPIYITENGLASTNDDRRVRFLLNYLKEIYHAISAGADVRGYFHWSLLDNFEWAEGFTPRFGLIEVDYKTQQRIVRPSAYVYQQIIQNNGIPHQLLKLLGHGIRVEDVIGKISDIK